VKPRNMPAAVRPRFPRPFPARAARQRAEALENCICSCFRLWMLSAGVERESCALARRTVCALRLIRLHFDAMTIAIVDCAMGKRGSVEKLAA